MTEYEFAKEIATRMHKGQVDKAGVDYIQHPIAVSEKVNGDKEKVIALLHDVAEDTPMTVSELRMLFDPDVCDALDCLNHAKSEPYMDYIKRVKGNKLATAVKLADIEHNMDLSRLPVIDDKAMKRVKKYTEAKEYLLMA